MELIRKTILLCLFAAFSLYAAAQVGDSGSRTVKLGTELLPKDTTKVQRLKNYLIAPKGEWQCGISVMYASFSSDNSEYMLLAQNMSADASVLRLAPEAAYTFAKNHAIGARFQYMTVRGGIDNVTADLLGNFSMDFKDVHARSTSMGGYIFERSYVGLDNRGRVGLYLDYVLGYTRTKSRFGFGSASDDYSVKKKIHLGISPGLVYFPMNNISVQASIGLADVGYTAIKAYHDGDVSGSRRFWKAQANLNVLALNFGLTIHL